LMELQFWKEDVCVSSTRGGELRSKEDDSEGMVRETAKFESELENCFVYFMHDETGDAANLAADFNKMLAR